MSFEQEDNAFDPYVKSFECKGDFCKNEKCEGPFCPASHKINFLNFSNKMASFATAFEAQAIHFARSGQQCPIKMDMVEFQGWITRDMAKIMSAFQLISSTTEIHSKIKKQQQDHITRPSRLIDKYLPEKPITITGYCCSLCNSSFQKGWNTLDCGHFVCEKCISNLDVDPKQLQTCFACGLGSSYVPCELNNVTDITEQFSNQSLGSKFEYSEYPKEPNAIHSFHNNINNNAKENLNKRKTIEVDCVICCETVDLEMASFLDCENHYCCYGCLPEIFERGLKCLVCLSNKPMES